MVSNGTRSFDDSYEEERSAPLIYGKRSEKVFRGPAAT